ncbi:fluoride efflux transporter FluC, partial [Leptospira borgpetersenii]
MNLESNLFLIGFGGAIGSVFRYLLQYWFGNVLGFALPWGTLTANLLGSFVIGTVYALFDRFPVLDKMAPLLGLKNVGYMRAF